ncbi:uncharacterized protein LOC114357705 isoform X2 [Ostrinia furnacalis]|uniref:uncharacterized protein LOC114357705 isoform X2 n=1 Tax=Ostrinia furnacalis TaxID=93504 RepID=UPI00103CCC33|nr:uncharacterized protein LOC114357705 isoform X2 [Ostrinia furnacalis]
MHSNSNVSTILLPTIKAKVLCRDGKSHKVVRGLVDSGSQVSFMTADLAKALQLPLIDSNLNITALGKQNKTTSKAVNAEFVSLQNNYKCQVNCSIVDQITTKLPQQQTVTYGLKSSSYLATRCLQELADRFGSNMPLAAEVIRTAMYVDDALFGAQTIDEALEVRDQFIDLLGRANLQLHKWAANDDQLLAGIPADKQHFEEHELGNEDLSMKALGVSFNVRDDVFKVSCPIKRVQSWNKRSILSVIGSFFDPLGLAGPIIVRAKEFLQKVWKENLEWDSPIPMSLLKAWLTFYEQLEQVPTISVQRNININNAQVIQLLGYCDASSVAYGCCIYIRVIQGSKVTTTLLCSKSRIAPVKNALTIPKLELNGAVLLAKLYCKVKAIYAKINFNAVHLFSDSQVVLCWLKSSRNNIPAYVKNRINLINSSTTECKWFHIDGASNPADCLSRGCNPQDLPSNTLWWHGPPQLDSLEYEPSPSLASCNHLLCERGPAESEQAACLVVTQEPQLFEKYSSWFTMQRIVAWILRFKFNCLNKHNKIKGNLTVKELLNAQYRIISITQGLYFPSEISKIKNNLPIKSNLKSLAPFIDGNGIMRVGGRLQNAPVPYTQKHPIILPNKCHVKNSIIRNEHCVLMHAGITLVLSSLKLKYWIISAGREVKKIINKCLKCYRFKAQVASQFMGSLPSDRVTESHPFDKVGIDFCGPFQVKQSGMRRAVVTKGYTLVIVCFATKAVHLELVSDMTTQTFLAALKRFIGRRGIPAIINCDNAQTFKGADNVLHDLYKLVNSKKHQSQVSVAAVEKGITFRYIPSYSPNHGGLWEAAVKSFKFHFKRVVGENKFTYEELTTILSEIEGILNSRPLTPLSSDPADLTALTPGHFLTGRPLICIPEPDLTDIPLNRLRFWRRCTQVKQHFWKAWYSQYLSQLNVRNKWSKQLPDVEEGSLVLLKGDNVPPLQWPMARVTRVFRGSDGRVRVAELKTATGLTRRSINKMCILPIDY